MTPTRTTTFGVIAGAAALLTVLIGIQNLGTTNIVTPVYNSTTEAAATPSIRVYPNPVYPFNAGDVRLIGTHFATNEKVVYTYDWEPKMSNGIVPANAVYAHDGAFEVLLVAKDKNGLPFNPSWNSSAFNPFICVCDDPNLGHTYTLTATSVKSGKPITYTTTIKVYGVPVTPPVISKPVTNTISTTKQFTVSGTFVEGTKINVYAGTTMIGTVNNLTVPPTTNGVIVPTAWSFFTPATLATGTYSITARTVTVEGYYSDPSNAVKVTIP